MINRRIDLVFSRTPHVAGYGATYFSRFSPTWLNWGYLYRLRYQIVKKQHPLMESPHEDVFPINSSNSIGWPALVNWTRKIFISFGESDFRPKISVPKASAPNCG